MGRVGRAAACAAIAVSAAALGAQQPSPPLPAAAQSNVIISGRVVAADAGGLVLRGARVSVVGGPTVAPVFTDGGGRFSVAVPADFALTISKAGFAPSVVTGRASAQSAELTIRLARGAAIEGQVVDDGGFPVSNARVRARRVDSAGGGAEFTADTDDAGAYRIGSLPAGRYQLHSERAAVDGISAQPFVDGQLRDMQQMREQQLRQQMKVPPMSAIVSADLRPGEQSTVTLVHQLPGVLPPDAPIGGFVSGVVSDEFGDPLAGVDVRLWRLRYSGGRYVAQSAGLPRRTDDRGRYRLFYVTPGRYVLAATVDDTRVAAVYYPGVTAVNRAQPLVIARKQDLPGFDLQFTRTYEARVFGFALNSAGDALRGTLTLQARRRSGEVALPPRLVTANADGTFEFLSVPPGEYALSASPLGGVAEPEFALQFVSVDGSDTPPITIRTAPTATLSGRIEVEGAAVRPTGAVLAVVDPDYPLPPATLEGGGDNARIAEILDALRAQHAAADAGSALAALRENMLRAGVPERLEPTGADATFVIRRLAGPVRFTMRNAAPGWWLKAVNIGGVNAVEEAVLFAGPNSSRSDVTVVFSSSAGDLSGRVTDERGAPADDYRVVVFSTNRDRWFAGSQFVRVAAGPDGDDGFRVTSLPPGEYFAAAVDGLDGDADSGEWQNPDVLAALSTRAQRVTVGERQRAAADLRLLRWAR